MSRSDYDVFMDEDSQQVKAAKKMVHDVRGPLAAIKMYLEASDFPVAEKKELIAGLDKVIKRVESYVTELRESKEK